ncbi:hypothetical protein LJC25_02370 [Bacteroidales bacterium OttesenSCG-928-K03]|nr:hypothetical protein [Odoribacter sp. OttesenSCG-928-L07]MDL2242555.1 hypothetical protein [Bacteroidales bacterium OttesenSCG-928-K03]
MKKLLLLLISFCTLNIYAQTNKEYEEFVKNRNAEFQQYEQSVNEEFSKFLEERWKEFNAMQGIPVPEKPKPDVMPNADDFKPAKPIKIDVEEIIKPTIIKEGEKITPEVSKIEEKHDRFEENPTVSQAEISAKPKSTFTTNALNFTLYNTKVETPSLSYFNARLNDVKEKNVSEFWNALDKANTSEVAEHLLTTKKQMQLNDWGFFNLCKETVNTVFSRNSANEKTVCCVYLLNQCGYEIKMGRSDNRLIYLLPSEQQIFKQAYINLDNKRYYIFEHEDKQNQRYPSVFTYKFDFDKNASKFNMNIYNPLNLESKNLKEVTKKINEVPVVLSNIAKNANAEISKSELSLEFKYNANIIDYYKNYPRTELIVYFNAAVDKSLSKSIKSQFEPFLKGKTELESVNIILKFINDNFKYKTDDDQFGYEKWFFCEENFYYPYGDCEDRSILFSWMVKELLSLDVVLLDYPKHIATAVHFNENVSGDYVTVNGKKYVICDPTYFNAKAGMCMPQYKNEKAKIITR